MKRWKLAEVRKLKELATTGLDTKRIAKELGRNYDSVYKKLSSLDYKPTTIWIKKCTISN